MRPALLSLVRLGTVAMLLCGPVHAQSPPDEELAPKPAEEVVAEGVGASADAALKDAFRNAVRQVVGAIVETETLVTNDKVVEDKVLTYSAGFVQAWDEIPGSKTAQNGIHRIRIKATVERSKIVARLKGAKVSLKTIEGKKLFGQVVTQLNEEKDAAELLEKCFEGYPANCWRAETEGKPTVIDKDPQHVRIKIRYKVIADRGAYSNFLKRVRPLLSRAARVNGSFSLKFERLMDRRADPAADVSGNAFFIPSNPTAQNWAPAGNGSRALLLNDLLTLKMPKALGRPKARRGAIQTNSLVLALCTGMNATSDHSEWSYYVLDNSLRSCISRVTAKHVVAKLRLVDAKGKTVAADEEEIIPGSLESISYFLMFPLVAYQGYSSIEVDVSRNALGLAPNDPARNGLPFFFTAPAFLCSDSFQHNRLVMSPIRSIPHEFSLTLDELRALDRIICEVASPTD